MSDRLAALERFGHVSLVELEERAALLDRQECKYVLSAEEFAAFVGELVPRFDALQIDGHSVFTYETTYFDTEDLLVYRQHTQGKRRRLKVRTRRYVESGLCFFEVKLKGPRGRTVKQRLRYDEARHGGIDDEARHFLEESVHRIYGESFVPPLRPALSMRYRRLTLVGRDHPERVTIDVDLSFSRPDGPTVDAPDGVTIVEVKSADGNGEADQILRTAGHRGTSCSKYCVGLNLLAADVRYNRLKPLLTRHFGWTAPVIAPAEDEQEADAPDGASALARRALGRVVDLLVSEFGPEAREDIERIVGDETQRFEQAAVRTYLPILIHRNARQRLARRTDAEPEAGATT